MVDYEQQCVNQPLSWVLADDTSTQSEIKALLGHVGFDAQGASLAGASQLVCDAYPVLSVIDASNTQADCTELVSQLKQAMPDMGIIVLLPKSQAESRAINYQSGADVCLIKPIFSEELIAILKNQFQRFMRLTKTTNVNRSFSSNNE